jgi:hypothetical protein
MKLPRPFQYPSSAHARRHGPAGYQDFVGFKEWLRDEFSFHCVYCLLRERWYPSGDAGFSVEHLVPRSTDRDGSLELDYDNLVYACCRCNANRGTAEILNPIAGTMLKHLKFMGEDGTIGGLTDQGQKTIRLLRLNDAKFVAHRRSALVVLDLKRENPNNPKVNELFVQFFGYPDNLPDLRNLRPPQGNTKPGSEETCYHVRRERGQLEEVY